MGAGNFFSGLLSGYAGTVANQEERAYKQHIAARTFDVQTAIKAMDDAVKTGDQTAIQAASANLNRAMQGLETPFDYHRGKGKKGGKGQQGGMNPIAQAAIAGIQRSAQQPSQPMDEKIPAGPQAGQSAQSVGLPAMPAPPQAAAPKPAPVAQTPPIPAPPASLESVYRAMPSPQTQAATMGESKGAEINALTDSMVKWDAQQGVQTTPQEKVEIQQHLAGIMPKLSTGRVLTGSFTPGNALPPNATDIEGRPIPEGGRTKDMAYGTWLAPEGTPHFFSVKPLSLQAGGGTTQTGIYQTQAGQSVPAFRSPKTGMIVDTAGNPLTGGTFVPTAQMPTSSQGTAFQVISGPQGEPQLVQIPISRTSQKVAPGASAPAPRQAGSVRYFGPKPEPLTQGAKQTIEDLTTAQDRLNQVVSQMKERGTGGPQTAGQQLWSKAKAIAYWEAYKNGFSVPEPYQSSFSTISLMSTLMSSQYLHGMRNMIWVKQIQQHMPSPTDTPSQIVAKVATINKNIPPLIQAIYKVEQPGIKHQQAAAPKTGPSKGDERDYQGHKYKFNGKVWVRE